MNTLKSLQYLASKKTDFDTPSEGPSDIDTDLTPKSKPKNHDNDDADSLLSKVNSRLSSIKTDFDDFDDCIDALDEYDEDSELKNSILAIGRKYARENAASGEASEIVQAFAPQESKLNGLINLINKDINSIEEDLREMRMARMAGSRNFKYISELTDVKSTLYSNQTAVIKELNQLKKIQFELRQKQKAAEAGVGDNSSAAQAIIQSMFGIGHDNLLSGVGGRAGTSGSYEDDYSYDDDEPLSSSSAIDTMRETVIDASDNDDGSDGAKFLKYENLGVEYVLEEDDDGHMNIYAEDKNGNRVDDYPLPTDTSNLSFERNERGGYATDQFARKYKLRHV